MMLDKEVSRIWLPLDPKAKNMLCKDCHSFSAVDRKIPFPFEGKSGPSTTHQVFDHHVSRHVETADRSCGNAYASSVLVRNATQVVVAGIKVAEGFCRMITVFETY